MSTAVRPLRKFRRDLARRVAGATAVECAVMLALVFCSLAIGAGFLSDAADGVFGQLHGSAGSRSVVAHGDEARASVQSEFAHATSTEAVRGERSTLAAVLLIGMGGTALLVSLTRRAWSSRAIKAAEAPPTATADQYLQKRQEILRAFSGDLQGFLTNHVLARHLMSTRLTTVTPTTTVGEMQTIMSGQKLRHLLVVDADGRLKGIVSDRDLHVNSNRQAQAIMTRKMRTCGPDTPLRQAVSSLLEWHISALPVVVDQRPVGIVTLTDVAMGLQCALQVIDRIANELTGCPVGAAAAISAAGGRVLHSPESGEQIEKSFADLSATDQSLVEV
jgi:CBS domain-containing protein